MTRSERLVDVETLRFAYDDTPVLSRIDLAIDEAELLALVGPNGSGKSTLLKCLNGIHEPDAGEVFLDGTAISELSRPEIARRVGYVPQRERGRYPATVFDTVLLGRRPHASWRPVDEDLQLVTRLLDRLDLSELSDRPFEGLSGGQRQKVTIARALAQQPRLLVLDEPTSDLDVRHQLEVLEALREERDRGRAVVMAIHDLNLATRFADRIAMLHDGRIHAIGGSDVLTPETIEEVYGVRAEVERRNGRTVVLPDAPIATTSHDAVH
ncbi:ABC transporter ATP-binding protein [Halalkaliarchaeum sp. AArc-GB]|uniref:ABC transporter ATP-binding protein n=1 Tax=Halalkaliarchaeum sp. AArc-GB TaxID=3074078 RepID=UPI00285506B7|nr:ABC transporter ATP-binding protein [Halalkaliarchaeum sp. AArc-GB]MDR5674130.1 ABC transporter ATP-binding protein [Halalkaliarchaeum sp. AArc-GB]